MYEGQGRSQHELLTLTASNAQHLPLGRSEVACAFGPGVQMRLRFSFQYTRFGDILDCAS